MNIYLSEGQVKKIKSAINKNESVNLRIDGSKQPNTKLPFIPKMNGNKIILNKIQCKQVGGFLPLLLAAAPVIAKAIGVGAAGYLGNKAMQKITGNGLKIPGKTMGNGLKIPGKQKGSGLKVPR